MKIRWTGFDGETILPTAGNPVLGSLFSALAKSGISIVEDPFGAQVDALVALNHSRKGLLEAKSSGVPLGRRILILWESPPVLPSQFRESIYKEYGRIFTLSPIWASQVKSTNAQSFPSPVLFQGSFQPDFASYTQRQNSACLIQANKFSLVYGELYSLRRSIISQSQRRQIPITIYGPHWNTGLGYSIDMNIVAAKHIIKARKFPRLFSLQRLDLKIQDYYGWIDNYSDAAQNHRVAVVVENSIDHFSEKAVLAIQNGTAVIYVGAKMYDIGFPNELVISSGAAAADVVDKLEEFLSLSVENQFEIVEQQFSALQSIRPSIEYATVWGDLINDIVEIFKA